MAIDPVAGTALDVVDDGEEPGILDVRRPAAARTHHVVVMAWLASDVGMLPAGQVDALDGAEFHQHLERAEHGRATDPQPAGLRGREEVRRREVALVGGDQVRDGASRTGQPIARGAQGDF